MRCVDCQRIHGCALPRAILVLQYALQTLLPRGLTVQMNERKLVGPLIPPRSPCPALIYYSASRRIENTITMMGLMLSEGEGLA